MCGELARRARRPDGHPRRLGRPSPRPRRARVRRPPGPHGDHAARDQPRAGAGGRRARAGDCATSSCCRRAGEVVARSPETVNPRMDDGRGRARGRLARDRLALDAPPVPARRGERRRDAASPLPLARSSPREAPAEPAAARADGRDHPPAHGGRRVPRHPDADPLQVDARGRARLRRAEPAAQGALLRAAAEPADPQAADDDRGLRPLLPDRDLLPRRGPAGRPGAGADAARRRDELPGPGGALRADGADVRDHLARLPRRRDPDAVAADDVRGGGPPVRRRTSRTLASRSRSRTRRRPRAARSSACSPAPRRSGSCACPGRTHGRRSPRSRRSRRNAERRGSPTSRATPRAASSARRSRSSSPRARSRRSRRQRARRCCSRPTRGTRPRRCSGTSGSISVASSG